jgi:hypothetical protein
VDKIFDQNGRATQNGEKLSQDLLLINNDCQNFKSFIFEDFIVKPDKTLKTDLDVLNSLKIVLCSFSNSGINKVAMVKNALQQKNCHIALCSSLLWVKIFIMYFIINVTIRECNFHMAKLDILSWILEQFV